MKYQYIVRCHVRRQLQTLECQNIDGITLMLLAAMSHTSVLYEMKQTYCARISFEDVIIVTNYHHAK